MAGNIGDVSTLANTIAQMKKCGICTSSALVDAGYFSESKTDFSNCGKMVLLSSKKLQTADVVPLYYTRQIAERLFGIAKEDLHILPLRTHSEPNFKGFMLLAFISLIIACAVKNRLGNKLPIEMALSTLRNLKCKVFVDSIIINELTKPQRLVLQAANVVVPKTCGV